MTKYSTRWARRRIKAISCSVAALAGLLSTGLMVVANDAQAVSTNGVRSISHTQGGNDQQQVYTDAEAVAQARRFDMIVGLKTTFRANGLTPLMRAANPKLKLLVYTNGSNASPLEIGGLPESAFSHDALGRRITNIHFGNYVMNPVSPAWQQYEAAECASFIVKMGADGCYLDDMGAGNLRTNYSAIPVKPNGEPYTDHEWVGATVALASFIRSEIPADKLIFANGLNSGAVYFGAQSSRFMDVIDGADAEAFTRSQAQPLTKFRPETAWKQDVDMLVDVGSKGKALLAETKVWIPAGQDSIERLHRYALATFMLGTDGNSYLSFNATGPGKEGPTYPLHNLNLGTPLSPYGKLGNLYTRNWSLGKVFVNPTTASVTVALGGNYADLDGATVSTLTLAPNTAQILKPVPVLPTTTVPPTTTTAPTQQVACNGLPATISGTVGDDLITGTPGRDIINGLGGSDAIDGLGGDDVICGGPGIDAINGGAGNDTVYGGLGNDAILGGDGDDTLSGWQGDDLIIGSAGSDRLVGGAANDSCVYDSLDPTPSCETVTLG